MELISSQISYSRYRKMRRVVTWFGGFLLVSVYTSPQPWRSPVTIGSRKSRDRTSNVTHIQYRKWNRNLRDEAGVQCWWSVYFYSNARVNAPGECLASAHRVRAYRYARAYRTVRTRAYLYSAVVTPNFIGVRNKCDDSCRAIPFTFSRNRLRLNDKIERAKSRKTNAIAYR